MNELVTIADGACKRGQHCGAGVLLVNPENGSIIEEHAKYTGEGTNNYSEYKAVLFAIEKAEEYAREKDIRKITILTDSALIVEQLNGVFKIKQRNLKPLHEEVTEEIERLRNEGWNIIIDQVSREYTLRADEIASEEALKAMSTSTEKKYPFLSALKKED